MRRWYIGAALTIFGLGCASNQAAAIDPRATDADAGYAAPPKDGGTGPLSPDAGAYEPHAGATVGVDGVLFRVWAPNVTKALVQGDFPEGSVALSGAVGGYFQAKVKGARAGSHYRFILDPDRQALTRIDPYCRELTKSGDCTVINPKDYLWKDANFVRPKREASVVYEMHVGSFAVPEGASQGTFASARAGLSGLADLGINVVELMPVHHFGGNPNGWGYNPQLYFAPKSAYGTSDDLRAFVDEAHRLGIAVWLDLVVNHYDGWKGAPLFCFDGLCPKNTAGIYFFGEGAYAATPWGPRPAFTEPDVANMIVDSVDQWLTEFHGDGFRWDSTSNIRGIDGVGVVPGGRELMVRANELTHARGAISVAEDLKGLDLLTKSATQGGFGFDAQWDGFGYSVGGPLEASTDAARDLGVIEGALRGTAGTDTFSRLLYTETHDTVGNGGSRLPNRLDAANPTNFSARRRTLLATTLLMTTPGVPMLFMGQEGLALGGFADPPAPVAGTNVKTRAFFRDLIKLRRDLEGGAAALSASGVEVLQRNDADKVLAYRRFGAGNDEVVVLLNFGSRNFTRYDIGVPNGGSYRVRVASDNNAYGDDFVNGAAGSIATIPATKDGRPHTLPIAIGPYGAVVLSR